MKKSRKLLISIFTVLGLIIFVGCERNPAKNDEGLKPVSADKIKIGMVYSSDSEHGKEASHHEGILKSAALLGLAKGQVIEKTNVPKDESCLEIFGELVRENCNVIFITDPIYEPFIDDFTEQNKDTVFCVFRGISKNNKNYDNYYGKIYKTQFMAGIAAGLKTVSNKIGYIITDSSWQSLTDCNAFALGVKAANGEATVQVKNLEGNVSNLTEGYAANHLVSIGCDILTSDTSSEIVSQTAENNSLWTISYGNKPSKDDKTVLTGSYWDWSVYYTRCIKSIIKGTWKPEEYFGDLEDKLFALYDISASANEKTKDYIEEIKEKTLSGDFEVFSGSIYDTNKKLITENNKSLKTSQIRSIDRYVDNIELK